MIKEALWVGRDGMDGIGMVIIGHRESKSTFSANKFEYFLPSFFIRLCRASIWQWPSAGLHGAELWSASLLCSIAMTAFILVVLTLPRFFVGLTVWKFVKELARVLDKLGPKKIFRMHRGKSLQNSWEKLKKIKPFGHSRAKKKCHILNNWIETTGKFTHIMTYI